MLVILGAMKEEIADIRKQINIEESAAESNYNIICGKYRNKHILLGQTGIGKEKAERTTEYILEHFQAKALICLGFAGALVDRLKVGDVVLITSLHCNDNQILDEPELQIPYNSDMNLVSIAVQTQVTESLGLLQATSVTVASPVCDPETKLALGKNSSAEVVDMESYWIARIASARQVPFINIRVISDSIDDRLPPFDRFIDSGGWQWLRTALFFLLHPQQLLGLLYLYRNARRARKNLTTFMDSFITGL